jgi:hypothetical protein
MVEQPDSGIGQVLNVVAQMSWEGTKEMLLSEMEVSTWNQMLATTGKTQAALNETTITVSDGYRGNLPGGSVETFITGELTLVMHSPMYYERKTYVKMDERSRDRLANDILSILKRKENIEVQDLDLNFQSI